MNKLIKDLSTDELYQLVRTHLYKDLAPVHGLSDTYVSENHKIVAKLFAHDKHQEYLPQNADKYNKLIEWAKAAGREPLYILSTPLGIWEFNLEINDPDFVNGIPCFNTDKGSPILSWYPEFNSEDEWVNAAMEELAEDRYSDPMEMDLDAMLEEMINSDEDYDKIRYDL